MFHRRSFSALGESEREPGSSLELVPSALPSYEGDDCDEGGSEREEGEQEEEEEEQKWDGVPDAARPLRRWLPCLLLLGIAFIAVLISLGAWFIHVSMHSSERKPHQ